MTQNTRARYEAPKLEIQRLRELPSALATSGQGCRVTGSKTDLSCSVSGTGGRTGN